MIFNICEALKNRDKQNDCKYDFLTTYQCNKYSNNTKKELIESLNNNCSDKKLEFILSRTANTEKIDLSEKFLEQFDSLNEEDSKPLNIHYYALVNTVKENGISKPTILNVCTASSIDKALMFLDPVDSEHVIEISEQKYDDYFKGQDILDEGAIWDAVKNGVKGVADAVKNINAERKNTDSYRIKQEIKDKKKDLRVAKEMEKAAKDSAKYSYHGSDSSNQSNNSASSNSTSNDTTNNNSNSTSFKAGSNPTFNRSRTSSNPSREEVLSPELIQQLIDSGDEATLQNIKIQAEKARQEAKKNNDKLEAEEKARKKQEEEKARKAAEADRAAAEAQSSNTNQNEEFTKMGGNLTESESLEKCVDDHHICQGCGKPLSQCTCEIKEEDFSEDESQTYSVVRVGGSIGEKSFVVKSGLSKEEAQEYAKVRMKSLSPGEKKYYGIKYKVVPDKKSSAVSSVEESLNDSVEVKMSRDDFDRMCRENGILQGLSRSDYIEIRDLFYIGYEDFDVAVNDLWNSDDQYDREWYVNLLRKYTNSIKKSADSESLKESLNLNEAKNIINVLNKNLRVRFKHSAGGIFSLDRTPFNEDTFNKLIKNNYKMIGDILEEQGLKYDISEDAYISKDENLYVTIYGDTSTVIVQFEEMESESLKESVNSDIVSMIKKQFPKATVKTSVRKHSDVHKSNPDTPVGKTKYVDIRITPDSASSVNSILQYCNHNIKKVLSSDERFDYYGDVPARNPRGSKEVVLSYQDYSGLSDDEYKSLLGESINPADLTDCPACSDVSFDSKRGRCTKCNYREESLNEDTQLKFDDRDDIIFRLRKLSTEASEALHKYESLGNLEECRDILYYLVNDSRRLLDFLNDLQEKRKSESMQLPRIGDKKKALSSNINQNEEFTNMNDIFKALNEADDCINKDAHLDEQDAQLTEDLSQEEIHTSGISAYITDAINGEYDTINDYNEMLLALKDDSQDSAISVIEDIIKEEYTHIGQLQELLKMYASPSSEIKSGEVEAQKQIEETKDDQSDSEFDNEFGLNSGFDSFI